MPETVLSVDDRAILDAALNKAPTEAVLAALRTELNHGHDVIQQLRRGRRITMEVAGAAREVLTTRIKNLEAVPAELVAPEVLNEPLTAARAALRLCDLLLEDGRYLTASRPDGVSSDYEAGNEVCVTGQHSGG